MELVAYNRELVRIVDDKSTAFGHSLKALELLAERTGDKAILVRVNEAKARIKALEASERTARKAMERAEAQAEASKTVAVTAQLQRDEERKRNRFLIAATSLDQDTTLNLHHQISYIRDYAETVSSLWAPRGVNIEVTSDEKPLPRKFRPIEVGIVIDNLVANAAKAHASKVGVFLQVSKGSNPELVVTVADDGDGWFESLDPLRQVLEKGVTKTDGAGLGLYHVRLVIEGLGGLIEVGGEPRSDAFKGAKIILRIPS